MFIKIMTLDTRELSFHTFFPLKMELGTVIYSSVMFLGFKTMKAFGKKKTKYRVLEVSSGY